MASGNAVAQRLSASASTCSTSGSLPQRRGDGFDIAAAVQAHRDGIVIARAVDQRLRRFVGDDAPGGDDDRAVTDRIHFFENVRGDHDDLVRRHVADQFPHLVLLVRIQAVGGLVQDQHRRVVQDGLGQSDAALETLGQRFRCGGPAPCRDSGARSPRPAGCGVPGRSGRAPRR